MNKGPISVEIENLKNSSSSDDSSSSVMDDSVATQLTQLEPTDEFQPALLYNAFLLSALKSNPHIDDHDDVNLRAYLIAYEEITKFLYNLGNIFYFVITDLRNKINIIDSYLTRHPIEYDTVQSMVKHEHGLGKLRQPQAQNKQNATRIVLRLHRALIFIIRLLERVFNAETNLRTPQLCTEAYESTLAKYHSWLIRRAATFGMRALPQREILISYMVKNTNEREKFPEFIRAVEKVYNITQHIYERYGILELP